MFERTLAHPGGRRKVGPRLSARNAGELELRVDDREVEVRRVAVRVEDRVRARVAVGYVVVEEVEHGRSLARDLEADAVPWLERVRRGPQLDAELVHLPRLQLLDHVMRV